MSQRLWPAGIHWRSSRARLARRRVGGLYAQMQALRRLRRRTHETKAGESVDDAGNGPRTPVRQTRGTAESTSSGSFSQSSPSVAIVGLAALQCDSPSCPPLERARARRKSTSAMSVAGSVASQTSVATATAISLAGIAPDAASGKRRPAPAACSGQTPSSLQQSPCQYSHALVLEENAAAVFAAGVRYVERPAKRRILRSAPPDGTNDFWQVEVRGEDTVERFGRSLLRRQLEMREKTRHHCSEEDAVRYAIKRLGVKLSRGYRRATLVNRRQSLRAKSGAPLPRQLHVSRSLSSLPDRCTAHAGSHGASALGAGFAAGGHRRTRPALRRVGTAGSDVLGGATTAQPPLHIESLSDEEQSSSPEKRRRLSNGACTSAVGDAPSTRRPDDPMQATAPGVPTGVAAAAEN